MRAPGGGASGRPGLATPRARRARLASACLVAGLLAAPASAQPSVSILALPFAVTEFRGPASRVGQTAASTDVYRGERALAGQPLVVLWGPEGGAVVTLSGGALRVTAARRGGDMSRLERGRDAVPGTRLAAEGAFTATLVEASSDYPHDALGSGTHGKAVAVAERRPPPPGPEPRAVATEITRVAAGPGAVFEDREPRFVDLDGDGVPEIVVVRSERDRGSSLAIIGRREGRWRIVAETPPDGQPFRWLNPAGLGPAGAGPRLVALVRRPHLDGLLQVWAFRADTLTLVSEKAGYANHALRQTAQDLAAVFSGPDGRPRLALPSLDRRAIAVVTLDAALTEVARIPLPSPAASGVAVMGTGAALHILVGLEDGRVADVQP